MAYLRKFLQNAARKKKKKENEKKERKVDDTVGAYVEYENFVSQKLQR